jgi:hypothetical protein
MPAPLQPFLKYADSFTALAKDFIAIQTKNLAKLNALQKEAVVAWCDSGTAHLSTASAPNSYQDWLDSQTKLLGEQSAKAQKFGTDYLKILEEGHTEFTAWLQRGTETATQSASEILKPTAA